MTCVKCPCPDVCLQWPAFCEWAAQDPPEPVAIEHICRRSRLGTGKPQAKAYPSVARMAGNALRAAARFVASGGQTVDQAEQDRRLAICRACEHFDAWQGRCLVCGCVAAWKARLQSEHCPLPEPKW